MNGKKAKQLRRECLGMPAMVQIWYGLETLIERKTLVVKRFKATEIATRSRVNHYRNAKKAYKGDVKKAVRAAADKAMLYESLGIYQHK